MNKYMKKFLNMSMFYGIFMGIYFSIMYDVYFGLYAGFLSGTTFGILMTLFSILRNNKYKKRSHEFLGDKELIMEEGSNYLANNERVGGWLMLTADELIFTSNKVHIEKKKMAIPIKKIKTVSYTRVLGIIPNGLEIQTIDGKKERFALYYRKAWLTRIEEQKSLKIKKK